MLAYRTAQYGPGGSSRIVGVRTHPTHTPPPLVAGQPLPALFFLQSNGAISKVVGLLRDFVLLFKIQYL